MASLVHCVCCAALKNKRANAHSPGCLSSPDEIFKRRRVRRRIRPNPRAACPPRDHGSLWGRRGSQRGRAVTAAERKSLIEGLRAAQEILSERVRKLSPGAPTPRVSVEGNQSDMSETPKLHSAPPDLCRKGTIVHTTSDDAHMAVGEKWMDAQGACVEQLLTTLKTSFNQAKSFTVNKGVGAGRVRRIFLTL